jgi:D-3-phosphoglycerate dehydrogenase
MNWTDEDLTKPQVLVETAHGMGHPGTFHFGPLNDEVSNGVYRDMKRSAVLVNSARGPIVEDAALYRALKEGWIAGAGLDDIEEEPAKRRDWKPTNPLFGLDNVIITPHAAHYSEESMKIVRQFASEEVVRVLSGHAARSPVNAV